MKFDVFSPSLAAVVLCYSLSFHAQTSPLGGRPDVQSPANQRPTYLSGRVASDDGSEIGNADITVRCQGEELQVAHPDPGGSFRFALGTETWGGISDTSMSTAPSMGNPPKNETFACEIRVSAAGFASQNVEMQQASTSGFMTDFGTIVLHRVDRIDQDLLSAKSASAPRKARSAYIDGLKAARQGNWKKAVSEFSKATAIDRDFAEAWSKLGSVQMILGDDTSAEGSLQNAIRADSKVASAYEGLSEIATRREHWTDVIRMTEKAVLLDPLHSARMWLLRCVAQYAQRDINGANESASRGLSSDTQHKFPRLELLDAQILLDKHDLHGALNHLQSYLQISPRASDAAVIRQKMNQIAALLDGKDPESAAR